MKHTLIRTEIPGPASRALSARRKASSASPMDSLAPFYIKKGLGAGIEDVDGNRFLDFTGGWGCLVTGYSPESVVRAVKAQAEHFLHSDFTVIPYEPWIELAERLAKKAQGKTEKAVAFFNSGAEAVENAVKIARGATKRRSIVVFEGAFHGRTLLTMTMTHRPMPYKYVFGTAPDVYRLPYPNPRKNRYKPEDFEKLLLENVCPEDVAAVVIEPIQGEGGFNVTPAGFLEEIRRVTSKYGILMVADEVQSGYGRTGKFFAIENWGVEPDLITLGKSIAGGLPLSAVVGDKKLFDALPKSSIGSTYGGNPLACAAAVEIIKMIDGQKLLERAVYLGKIIRKRFEGFKGKYPAVKEVRGIGAMLAIEFIKDEAAWSPDTETCQKVIQEARDNGVILAGAGLHKNVIRLLLPLVITDEQLVEGLDIIDKALAAATKAQPRKAKAKK
ncbi:MAG: 4-aminobutyrate--2-oxoglutarate transaminase [Elusimicrobia bacterium RIFCSPLOWO2_02_FULL_61_11]|nr:MAG: 4-aminobutyrate--2-oxoglutarate transaminase [Elusimicrobia bacterium RIFCSPLOWO2_02_FULL_61_11]